MGEWYTALTAKYGFTREQAIYFSTREKAEVDSSNLGAVDDKIGGGGFNRTVLERVLQDQVEFRAGYTIEYCALTMIELHAQMQQAAMDNPYP
jgi:hypothetical protein